MEHAENPIKSRQDKKICTMTENATSEILERLTKCGEGEYFRRSERKDHDSKFELWDSVWIMHNNQPIVGKVCEIDIIIRSQPHGGLLGSVKYKLSHVEIPTSKNFQEYFVEVEEDKCFSTKEELLNNL